MKRFAPILVIVLSLATIGYVGYARLSQDAQMARIDKARQADNVRSIADFRTDIAKVQAVFDAAPRETDGLPGFHDRRAGALSLEFARQWVDRAEQYNAGDPSNARVALSAARTWLEEALSCLGQGKNQILSDWKE